MARPEFIYQPKVVILVLSQARFANGLNEQKTGWGHAARQNGMGINPKR
jgi:hypothetical protein